MSTLELIPAIDLKGGQCVRLRQGRMEDATVFGDDPVAMARSWEARGAKRLHVVDLDGAFAGEPVNRAAVEGICAALSIPVQIGGGIRDDATFRAYLEAGVRWGIVGTRAAREPAWVEGLCQQFPGRVIVGIDAREGFVATEGWAEASRVSALELARRLEQAGVAAVIYTDIHRDGMGTGINLEETLALAEALSCPVIASGGLHDLDDLTRLKAAAAEQPGALLGAISGRALYEGSLDFEAGLALLAS